MPNNLKKILLPFLLLLSSMAAFAQPTQDEKKLLFDKIDTLLYYYVKYSSFLESGKDRITPEAISKFKKLFVSESVLLPDGMSPAYFDKAKSRSKVPSFSGMDEDLDTLKGKVPMVIPGKSQSKLNKFKDSLDRYFSMLDEGRTSYFGKYNSLNKDITDFKIDQQAKEKFVYRSLDEFVVMLEANYPDGLFVKLLNSIVSFNEIDNNIIKLLLESKVSGKISGAGGVKLESHDTLLITLQVGRAYSSVLIDNIEMIGHSLSFLNDRDRDFVADDIDACPDEKGLNTPSGCPTAIERQFDSKMVSYLKDRSTDSSTALAAKPIVLNKIQEVDREVARLEKLIDAPPHWLISLGLTSGILTSTLTNSNNNYTNNIIKYEKNPTSRFSGGKSIGIEAMGEHYFGEKSAYGIGVGLAFTAITGNIQKDSFHVEYEAKDVSNGSRNGLNSFTQLISSLGSIEEKVSLTNFSLPIVAIYKGKITGKIGFKVEGGIAVNFMYKSSMSSTNAKFKYEAAYKYSNPYLPSGGQNFFDPRNSQTETGFDKSSWIITESFAKQHTSDYVKYFEEMARNNYLVGLNVDPVPKNGNASFNLGLSFILRPSLSINFTKGQSLNLGLFYSKTTYSQTEPYRLIDESKSYNSLMQGVAKMSNSNFGIRISYSYSLFYTLSKWTKELSGLR